MKNELFRYMVQALLEGCPYQVSFAWNEYKLGNLTMPQYMALAYLAAAIGRR